MFALFSALWPHTGSLSFLGRSIPRGYLFAILYSGCGFLILSLGRLDAARLPAPLRFVRYFYPQAYFGILFGESILLSAPMNNGKSHDALFANFDAKVFGFEPAREFSAYFQNSPVMNELMFGAYFCFYFILIFTPWIAWFRGNKGESGREMAILSLYMLIVYCFYMFFRVEGPKYYLADLHDKWYAGFRGGIFTNALKAIFSKSTLSGSAFPSSHVAVSIMMTFFVYKTEKRLLPLYIVMDCLIAAATVYLYAHWAADVVGGVVTAFVLVPLLGLAFPYLERAVQALNHRLGLEPVRTLGHGMAHNE